MADDQLDSLYQVAPDVFTAQRAKLVAAAKDRGDAAAAKRISAARKPTTAAWIVNRLALRRSDTTKRLTDLGDRLRDAHAAMDGERVRDLSAEQHRLVADLARAAFEAVEVKRPSASVRDDVTGTLQAAIADPDVAARLGRLAKPERWSGFGEFGDAVPPKGKPNQPPRDTAAQRRREKLNAAVAAAERAQADALAALRTAKRGFSRAEADYDKAKRASRDAAEAVKEAKARLKRE